MEEAQFKALLPPEARDRFLKGVRFGPKCWVWTRGKCKGYGRFHYKGKTHYAYRLAYEWTIGPVPENMELDHVRARGCTRRDCVRPSHLEPVTSGENVRRGFGASGLNAKKTHCKRGHPLVKANLIPRVRSEGTNRRCKVCANLLLTKRREERGIKLGISNRAKTHCKKGHPLEAPNLEPYNLRKKGIRVCLVCWRFNQKAAVIRRANRCGKSPKQFQMPT